MGRGSIRALQREISSIEFAEWQAYFRLEPFGAERADLRSAIVASVIANVNRDPRKQKQPFKPSDFMLRFDDVEPEQAQTWQQQLEFSKLLSAAGFGGQVFEAKPRRKRGARSG